jgi:hypothetical protein
LCGRCGDQYLDAVERVRILGEASARVELEQLENGTISTQKKEVSKA